jgi:hypothetical protein
MVISCDADPLIKEKSIGYNIWFNEPDEVERLSNEGRHLENNLFFFRYPFEPKKIQKFTLYPCRLKRQKPDDRLTKIIYISEIDTNFAQESLKLWEINKNKLLEDLSCLESGELNLGVQSSGVETRIYIDLKRLIRMELVIKLKEVYGDRFILVGKDWKKIGLKSIDINYDRSFRRYLYGGNIAVDFGAQCGSAIFYQRSFFCRVVNRIRDSGLRGQSRSSMYTLRMYRSPFETPVGFDHHHSRSDIPFVSSSHIAACAPLPCILKF